MYGGYRDSFGGGALAAAFQELNRLTDHGRLMGRSLAEEAIASTRAVSGALEELNRAGDCARLMGRSLAEEAIASTRLVSGAVEELNRAEDCARLMGRSLAEEAIASTRAISGALEKLDRISDYGRLMERSLVEEVITAKRAASAAFEEMESRAELVRTAALLQPEIRRLAEGVQAYQGAAEAVHARLEAMQPSTATLAAFNEGIASTRADMDALLRDAPVIDRFVQDTLATLDWRHLHGILGPTDHLQRATAELVASYLAFDPLVVSPRLSDLAFTIETLPGIEIYAHANLLRGLGYVGTGRPAESEDEEEEPRLKQQIAEKGGVTLQSLLSAHYPGFFHVWQGTRAALTPSNPDRVRHYCTSCRQLLLELLPLAAPDEAVRGWTSDPEHYVNQNPKNRPTWQARILFLFERADLRQRGQFAISDARAAMAVYSRLNKGVHKLEPAFDSRQFTDLQIRGDNLLLFVLLVSIEAQH